MKLQQLEEEKMRDKQRYNNKVATKTKELSREFELKMREEKELIEVGITEMLATVTTGTIKFSLKGGKIFSCIFKFLEVSRVKNETQTFSNNNSPNCSLKFSRVMSMKMFSPIHL